LVSGEKYEDSEKGEKLTAKSFCVYPCCCDQNGEKCSFSVHSLLFHHILWIHQMFGIQWWGWE